MKIRPNGDMIIDAKVVDAGVNGLKDLKVIKCPNVYSNLLDEAIYEGLSLRDIFETNNLVVNGDFSDGTTGWSLSNVESDIVNENIYYPDIATGNLIQSLNITLGNDYFVY